MAQLDQLGARVLVDARRSHMRVEAERHARYFERVAALPGADCVRVGPLLDALEGSDRDASLEDALRRGAELVRERGWL